MAQAGPHGRTPEAGGPVSTGSLNGEDRAAPGGPLSRRLLLQAVAAGASSACLPGCSKRLPASLQPMGANLSTAAAAVDTESVVQAYLQRHPLPPRYRTEQPYLFQSLPSRDLASRLPDGRPMYWDIFGPTHRYVDAHTGWSWTRPGGDWVDAAGLRHGPTPWFSVAVDAVVGTEQSAPYVVDVTRLVRHVHAQQRWLAILLMARGAPRTIAGALASRHSPPAIDVVYADGQQARLRCRLVASLQAGSLLPATTAPEVGLPAGLEFERPAREVKSAMLRFAVTAHWSGRNPSIEGFLIDPPMQQAAPRDGLASATGVLDNGLASHPAVIGVHRYTDDRPLADFVHANGAGLSSEHNFDPAIYGSGPQDRSKWPHAGLGKWINASTPWELVRSGYRDEGFKPLAPGLGALRIHMPAAPQVRDGAVVGYDGTAAGYAMIFLPEPLFGRLDRIFVRYYLRLGLPGQTDARRRYQVRHTPNDTDWTSLTGKFGIGPDHSTSQGGVSGTSGGGAGWQMRLGWAECDASEGGPDERGWAPGFHLYDFQGNNPVGHRYGSEQAPQFAQWGQQGGTGGMLYAGHWYCIETELKLNSVSPQAPGYAPDGELRAWLDGRLVFERSGMVFRSLPLAQLPANPSRLRPCRELGVRGLWLNWFHGGKTVNTVDRTIFYTGLSWARQYIGPMAL